MGISHSRCLLKLIELISDNQLYDNQAVWIAAHLHDWGGYSKWIQEGKDHAVRSKEVAAEYLIDKDLPEERLTLILECIEFHHSKNPDRRFESVLLSDADALDFLGVIGLLRIFSKQEKNLKKAYETVKKKIQICKDTLQLETSKKMADDRISRMN